MLRLVIFCVLLISSAIAAAVLPEEVTTIENKDSTTIKAEVEASPAVTEGDLVTSSTSEVSTTQAPSSTTAAAASFSSTTENSSLEESSHESSEEEVDSNSNSSHEIPLVPISPSSSAPPKRKVLYINQQQSGKLNVHLELNDVSLIVIPNKKDPQLSLLNLLLRSAQKSNLKHNNEEKKKEENAKVNVHHQHNQDDDYSQKYKMDNYMHAEPMIESRAPYRVDISSTLGQQPVVDIMNNGKFQSHADYARSPMVKLLKPVALQPHVGRIYKRSIDTSFLRFNPDVLNDSSISQNNSDEEEEQELINSLESNQNINGVESHEDLNNGGSSTGSEFVLLGAVEDCGPGRRRNSYMICVAIDE